MKAKTFVQLVAGSLFAIAGPPASAAAPDLKALYDNHQWIELRDAVKASNAPVFYRGAADAAFNDFTAADKNLRAALGSAPTSGQSDAAHELLIELYMRSGRYRDTLGVIEAALAHNPAAEDLKNVHALYSAMSKFPEQSMAAHGPSKVSYRMKNGNMYVPFTINGKQADFLVDTGANFSMISESEARRLGLEIRDAKGATMGDSSGTQLSFRMALADRLSLGNAEFRHVLFLVVGDDQQPFVSLAEGERGVIGFPVLFSLEKLRWNKAGEFETGFATRPEKGDKPNLYFDGMRMFVRAQFSQGKLDMFIDTGATHTRLMPRFATDYPVFVQQVGVKGTNRVTGVSGSVEVDAMMLPELKFSVRGSETTLDAVPVLLKDTAEDMDQCHAWIGMDMMKQVDSVTIDFKAMSFTIAP